MTYSVIKIEKERREIIMYNYDYDDCNSYEIREDNYISNPDLTDYILNYENKDVANFYAAILNMAKL